MQDLQVQFACSGQIVHAVRGVDWALFSGETVGIVGESGCGKSTLAKALLRLCPPSSQILGRVLYKGFDINSLSNNEMRKVRGKEISMIFQDPMTSLNPTMKIGAQIAEALKLHQPHLTRQQRRDVVMETLALVGIPHPQACADAYPHTLSGGMRQRAMIALAIACKPSILVADEPTTALDVTIQAQIIALLKSLQKRLQMSVLLITHDLSVVANFCHRTLVMYAGKIVESASTEELFHAPKHPYTKRLFASLPRLDHPPSTPLTPIAGAPPSLIDPPKGCSFCARCDAALPVCHAVDPLFQPHTKTHHFACHNPS